MTLNPISYSINTNVWVPVYQNYYTDSHLLGYTKRISEESLGQEIIGSQYGDNLVGNFGQTKSGKNAGKWIKVKVALWAKKKCNSSQDGCADGQYQEVRDSSHAQKSAIGFITEDNLSTSDINLSNINSVLGISVTQATEPSLNMVEVASISAHAESPKVSTVEITTSSPKEAVVNRAMINVLGIKESVAVGTTFIVTFSVVGGLSDAKEQIQSNGVTYRIIGVIPEERSPIFYVPFIDIRSMGVINYSQLKVIVKTQSDLIKVRRQIEAMGFSTRSVVDTVNQINNLFSTARTLLGLLGLVALVVASLGMFNTLTVSLLERTREVGLMKALGMTSSEVEELFLTESMIMGIMGGVIGIISGFIFGKTISILVSLFTIYKGVGSIDMFQIPWFFTATVLLLSLIVGLITGIYPARRATKISALNALRYE